MGGVGTLRCCLMAPFPIHLAPLEGPGILNVYIYIYTKLGSGNRLQSARCLLLIASKVTSFLSMFLLQGIHSIGTILPMEDHSATMEGIVHIGSEKYMTYYEAPCTWYTSNVIGSCDMQLVYRFDCSAVSWYHPCDVCGKSSTMLAE